ncbi:MAG: TnpV protein [Oscillospiraceae bacterium]|nr:TnpV protein [Oscillospiraceae bacterium]
MSQKNKQQYDLEYYADLIGKTDHMIDPENGLSYHREGEVWIPDIVLEPELTQDERPTFPWGMRRRDYLKEHRPCLYLDMLMDGTLWTHMKDVQELAQARLDRMIPEMAKAWGVTEEMKRQDQLKWVGLMNNIRHSVEETIYEDLIYS